MTVKDIANITTCSIYIIDKKDVHNGRISRYDVKEYNKYDKNDLYSKYTVLWIDNDNISIWGTSLVLTIDKNEFDK